MFYVSLFLIVDADMKVYACGLANGLFSVAEFYCQFGMHEVYIAVKSINMQTSTSIL
jgi:hypothetical protein